MFGPRVCGVEQVPGGGAAHVRSPKGPPTPHPHHSDVLNGQRNVSDYSSFADCTRARAPEPGLPLRRKLERCHLVFLHW